MDLLQILFAFLDVRLGFQIDFKKPISFHLIQHTCILIALKLSSDIVLVSHMCGHKKIASTMIYTKISDTTA
jgi:site-specific recombinase XerD